MIITGITIIAFSCYIIYKLGFVKASDQHQEQLEPVQFKEKPFSNPEVTAENTDKKIFENRVDDYDRSEMYHDPSNMKDKNTEDTEYIPDILITLIKRQDLSNLKLILDFYPELITGPILDGKYLLHLAIQESYTDLVAELINRGCNVNIFTKDSVQSKPIHLAAKLNTTEILDKLLEKGAEIDATDVNGDTPLMYAVICDQTDSVKYLLDRGANPNKLITPTPDITINTDDIPFKEPAHIKTILNTAISLNHDIVVKLLLDNNADPSITDSLGMNALHSAAFYGRTDLIDNLLATNKIDINAKMADDSVYSNFTALEVELKLGHDTFSKALKQQKHQ